VKNGRNDIEEYLYIEWLEAREAINAIKKRKKQSRTKREYLEASPRRLPTETSSSYKLLTEAEEF
jgi:hypothetical protein